MNPRDYPHNNNSFTPLESPAIIPLTKKLESNPKFLKILTGLAAYPRL
jgi:hypothetical protein